MSKLKYTRFVMVQPEWGIYLGHAIGLSFWSKLEAAGQDSAVAFISETEGRQHIDSWDVFDSEIMQQRKKITFVEVKTDNSEYATLAECVAAGLDKWNPES